MPVQRFLSTQSNLIKSLILILGYLLLTQISHFLSIHYGTMHMVWPSAGFAVTVLLLMGYRFWPVIVIAAFLSNFLVYQDLASGFVSALSNGCISVLAYTVLRMVNFDLQMKRLSDVLAFVILAGVLAPIPGVLIECTSLWFQAGFSWYKFVNVFLTWWTSDAIGIIMLGPFILSLRRGYFKHWTPARFIEWVVVHTLLAIALIILFYILGKQAHHDYYPLAYLPLPFLIWSTVRFGQQGAALANLLIVNCTLSCSLREFGHFGKEGVFRDPDPLIMACVFSAILAVASLILASYLEERKVRTIYNRKQIHFFHQIIKALPTPICIKDAEGKSLLCNNNWSLWNIKLTEKNGEKKRFSSRKTPTQSSETDLRIERPFVMNGQKGIALQIKKKIAIETEKNDILLEQWQDITPLKKIQENLEKTVSRFHSALATAEMGYWRLNIEDNILHLDDLCRQLTGFPENCSLGQFEERMFPEDKSRYQAAFKQTPLFCEFRYRHPSGATLWLGIKGNLFSRTQIIGVLYDISSEKNRIVSLQKTKDAEERAHMAKSVFMANLTEATGKAMSNLLKIGIKFTQSFTVPLSLKQKELAANVRKGINTIGELMDNVHVLSTAEMGQQAFHPKKFAVNEFIKESVKRAEIKAYIKNITFHYFVDPAIPATITTDEHHLQQILDNLFSNAIKSIHSGQGEITLTLQIAESSVLSNKLSFPADPQALFLHFSLQDTGVGIAQERLSYLFDAFTQVDPKNVTRHGTNCLGLAVCKCLAEHMGGTIWVDTEEGKGSIFHLLIKTNTNHVLSKLPLHS